MRWLDWLYCGGIASTLWVSAATAQENRPSEKDILLEKVFIEAGREKILGNYQEAVARYLEVLQKDNSNAPACYELAKLYDQLNQPDQAITRAARAVEIAPSELIYVRYYARLLDKQGNSKKAADLYDALVKTYPKNEGLYYEWSDYLSHALRHDQVIKVLDGMEKLLGLREPAILRKSEAYFRLDKSKKSIEELEKLANAYPDFAPYQLHVAKFYQSDKQPDKARQWYERVLKNEPNNEAANLYLADHFLTVKKDTSKYLQALTVLFEKGDMSDAAMSKALAGMINAPRYNNALRNLAQLYAQQQPSSASAHLLYGRLLFEVQQYAAAAEEYEMGLEIDKNQLSAWATFLECHVFLGKLTELQAKALEVMELFPNHAEGYYYAAESYFAKGEYEKAVSELEYALPMVGSRPDWKARVQALLGKSYAKAKKTAQAEKMLPENARQFPDDAYALAGHAWWLCRQKQYGEAKNLMEKALSKGGDQCPPLLEQMGDTYYFLNDASNALLYWRKAADKGNHSTTLQQKITTKQAASYE